MRQRIFDAFAAAASRRPWFVMIGALALTGIAASQMGGLHMETRVLDLLPKDDPAAIEFNDIVRQYSSASQIMVGIKGGSREQKIAFALELKARAGEALFRDRVTGAERPYVKRVVARADADFIEKHGLMLVKERDLQNLDEIFQDLDLVPLLAAYNDFLEREYVEDSGSVTEREKEDRAIDSLKNLLVWLEGIERAGEGPEQARKWADMAVELLSTGETYMFSEDDAMMIVLVTPAVSMDRYDEMTEGVEALRDVIEEIKHDYPDLQVRMTGLPALSVEEMEIGFDDMEVSSVVSLVLVLLLFVLSFRMWTAPLLAIVNLVLGIVWTTGFTAVVIGRLNLFTLMFAIILLGLGVDFAIHLNAAFATARSEGKRLEDAIAEMYRRAGAGVVTGGVTTAAAFFALALTGLDALAELGLVLGAGILLTLFSSLTVLPAMYSIHVRVGDRFRRGEKRDPKPLRLAFPILGRMGTWIGATPWPALAASALATTGLAWVALGAEFEPDMLEIEPPDMPSVLLHREILDRYELHPDSALVTSPSFEKTREMVRKLKKNRLVGRVDAITDLVPSDKEQKRRARIATRIGERMRAVVERVEAPGAVIEERQPEGDEAEDDRNDAAPEGRTEALFEEIDRLQMNVQEIGQLAFTSVKKRLQRACDRLSGGDDPGRSKILALKSRLQKAGADLNRWIEAYQDAYVPLLAGRLERMAGTEPITLDSLPDSIEERYMSAEGSNLVTIYSSVDLWHEGKTELFMSALKKASERVTGLSVLVERVVDLVGSKGLQATVLTLVVVFVILLFDFRHLGYALLGMVPLVAGFVWMVGLFVLFGRRFDVANVMALPLILGIGIDDGVHVLHSIRRLGAGALSEVLQQTGRALLLTSLTTGIAFGSIAFASHRGMAGMGLLLVLGVVSCFIMSVVLLPALIRISVGRGASKGKVEGGRQ